MKTQRQFPISRQAACALALVLSAGILPASLQAQQAKKKGNPASKVYFADVKGAAEIQTDNRIEDLSQRNVYTAQGTVIETKPARPGEEPSSSTMVYSNGTGAYFDTDTRVEIKRFVQEPFIPNRSDVDVEPSISQTQAFVSRGVVGLCSSKLVAGSSMNYQTPHASVNIRGRRVVIEAAGGETKISMVEGTSTVRAGEMDMGGHVLKEGEQAIIRPGAPGQPNQIAIVPIPPQELTALQEKTEQACAAKRTVYFEVRDRTEAAGAATDGTADAPITAFDGDSSISPSGSLVEREIVPVPVVPVNLPTEFTVSPATLAAPATSRPNG